MTAARIRTALLVVLAGAGVGFLIGFFGVGGGFMIVPALVLLFGIPMSAARWHLTAHHRDQLGGRTDLPLRRAGIDWPLTVPFALTAVLGTLAGRRAVVRLPPLR